MRHLQDTIIVLAVTVLTTVAVYSGVSALGTTSLGAVVASATTSGSAYATDSSGTLTCPATGCAASSCHATGGANASDSAGTSGSYGRNGHAWGMMPPGTQQYSPDSDIGTTLDAENAISL